MIYNVFGANMDTKAFIKGIIAGKRGKGKKPKFVVPTAPKDKNKFSFKPNILSAPMGPERYLATKNQPSGAHTLKERKPKAKQKLKNELRKSDFRDWD